MMPSEHLISKAHHRYKPPRRRSTSLSYSGYDAMPQPELHIESSYEETEYRRLGTEMDSTSEQHELEEYSTHSLDCRHIKDATSYEAMPSVDESTEYPLPIQDITSQADGRFNSITIETDCNDKPSEQEGERDFIERLLKYSPPKTSEKPLLPESYSKTTKF